MNKQLRIFEYLHIPFWLVKDTCWAMEIKWLGMLMILPTLTIAYLICFKTWKDWLDFLPNLAILLWISANSIWMTDEFFKLGIKNWCYVPFISGTCIILVWLFVFFPKFLKEKE